MDLNLKSIFTPRTVLLLSSHEISHGNSACHSEQMTASPLMTLSVSRCSFVPLVCGDWKSVILMVCCNHLRICRCADAFQNALASYSACHINLKKKQTLKLNTYNIMLPDVASLWTAGMSLSSSSCSKLLQEFVHQLFMNMALLGSRIFAGR